MGFGKTPEGKEMKILLSLPNELRKSGFEQHVVGLIKSLFEGGSVYDADAEALYLEGRHGQTRLFDLIHECDAGVFIPHYHFYDDGQRWQIKVCFALKKPVYWSDGVKIIKVENLEVLNIK